MYGGMNEEELTCVMYDTFVVTGHWRSTIVSTDHLRSYWI